MAELNIEQLAQQAYGVLGSDDDGDGAPVTRQPTRQPTQESRVAAVASEGADLAPQTLPSRDDDPSKPKSAPTMRELAEPVQKDSQAVTPADSQKQVAAALETAPSEPPAFWDADAKERFKSLGPDAQKLLLDQERARESVFGKTQREAAEIRKAAEVERQAVVNERQTIANRLTQLIDQAKTIDPVLAEGAKRNWVEEAKTDPAGTQVRWMEYQQRLTQVQQMDGERQRLLDQNRQEMLTQANTALASKLDFWGDNDKRGAFQSELRTYLSAEGYSTNEIAQASDARAILLARKAMLYDKLMASQSTLETQRATKAPMPTKVISSRTPDSSAEDTRANRLKARALATGKVDDAAAAVLAAIS